MAWSYLVLGLLEELERAALAAFSALELQPGAVAVSRQLIQKSRLLLPGVTMFHFRTWASGSAAGD